MGFMGLVGLIGLIGFTGFVGFLVWGLRFGVQRAQDHYGNL